MTAVMRLLPRTSFGKRRFFMKQRICASHFLAAEQAWIITNKA